MPGLSLVCDHANGLPALLGLRAEIQEASLETAMLERERAARAREVRALDEDPFEIERRAREDLGMIFPGERVVRCCT